MSKQIIVKKHTFWEDSSTDSFDQYAVMLDNERLLDAKIVEAKRPVPDGPIRVTFVLLIEEERK